MKAQTAGKLLDGEYICPVAFPSEYEFLQNEQQAAAVNEWLGVINKRLARAGEDGPFFMASISILPAERQRVKEDMTRFRTVYGPCIHLINLIRLSKDDFELQSGATIQLAELESAVNQSGTIEALLRRFQMIIRETASRYSNRELLSKLLDHLTKDGYLVLINKNADIYQVTGKIAQLKAVLAIAAECQPIISLQADDEDLLAVQDEISTLSGEASE